MGRFMRPACLLGGALLAAQVAAWDGAVSGPIAAIDIAHGQNYGFRVGLAGGPTMCTGGATWAYLNESDSNYRTFVAALLLAKAQQSRVLIYSNLENGQCHIGYISVSS